LQETTEATGDRSHRKHPTEKGIKTSVFGQTVGMCTKTCFLVYGQYTIKKHPFRTSQIQHLGNTPAPEKSVTHNATSVSLKKRFIFICFSVYSIIERVYDFSGFFEIKNN
jgi:hypothetical protein